MVDNNHIDIDQMFLDSLGEMKQNPSSSSWNNIELKLSELEAKSSDIDHQFEAALSGISAEVPFNSWQKLEDKLDAIDANQRKKRRRVIGWFTATGTVAALLFYFALHFQAALNPLQKDGEKLLVNENIPSIQMGDNEIDKTQPHAIQNNDTKENTKLGDLPSHEEVLKPVAVISKENKESTTAVHINESASNQIQESITEVAEKSYGIGIFEGIKFSAFNAFSKKESAINLEDISMQDYLIQPIRIKSLRASTGFSVDLFIGPEFIHQKEQSYGHLDEAVELQNIKPITSELSFGMNLNYHYNNFFILSGIAYSNYGEESTYKFIQENHDTSGGYYNYDINTYYTHDTLGYFDDPLQPGVLVPYVSSTLHTDTIASIWNSQDSAFFTSNIKKVKSRYRYIEVPLMVGYKISYKNWGFQLSAGASYGFKVAEEGQYVEDRKVQNIESVHSPYYDSNINGIASIGISYAIGNNLSILLQPTYKANLSELSSFNVHYQNLSLRAGINLKL